MFTGIVEAAGRVRGLRHAKGRRCVLELELPAGRWRLKTGGSLAVNGVCLTVVSKTNRAFSVEAIPTTLDVTNLGRLKKLSSVNLERALRVNDRLSGHFVQGHVDGVGRIQSISKKPDEWIFKIRFPLHLSKFLIRKGSIAMDGISLTVQKIKGDLLEVALIPHTLQTTILKTKKVGEWVNLEVDFLAKYLYEWNVKK